MYCVRLQINECQHQCSFSYWKPDYRKPHTFIRYNTYVCIVQVLLHNSTDRVIAVLYLIHITAFWITFAAYCQRDAVRCAWCSKTFLQILPSRFNFFDSQTNNKKSKYEKRNKVFPFLGKCEHYKVIHSIYTMPMEYILSGNIRLNIKIFFHQFGNMKNYTKTMKFQSIESTLNAQCSMLDAQRAKQKQIHIRRKRRTAWGKAKPLQFKCVRVYSRLALKNNLTFPAITSLLFRLQFQINIKCEGK